MIFVKEQRERTKSAKSGSLTFSLALSSSLTSLPFSVLLDQLSPRTLLIAVHGHGERHGGRHGGHGGRHGGRHGGHGGQQGGQHGGPVSYTHLTLPTIYSV